MKSENRIDLDSLNITKGIKKKCILKTCKDITKEKSNFYTYHLIDSRNNLPFYVGKGRGNRMYKHAKYVKNGKIPNDNRYLFNKIRKILSEDGVIDYKKILENVIEKTAFDKEIQDIKKYGRKNNGTGILCNMTDGGEGTSGWHCSQKTRYRMSKSALKRKNNHWIGKKHTEEAKRKMSLAKKGQIPWIAGKHHTEESNIKNRESHKGIVISEETKRKMRENHADRCGENNPMFGKHHTEESKEKMSDNTKNRNFICVRFFIFKNVDTNQIIKINNLKQWCVFNKYKVRYMRCICQDNQINKNTYHRWKCIEKTKKTKILKNDYYNNKSFEILDISK